MNQLDPTTAQQLLDRYFEGETSLAEEADLRGYFSSGEVDPSHREFTSLFAYWSAAAAVEAPPAKALRMKPRLRSLRWVASVAAAVLLLLIANAWCNRQPDQLAGPYAETTFPMETSAPAPKTIDWSKYEVSADEEGYRALRGALKTVSTALNEPSKGAVREMDKLGSRLR